MSATSRRTYNSVEVGDPLPELRVPIGRATLVRYAGASGDFNPIHWNERFAREVGLPDVIGHGMLSMAVAARVATDWAGDPGAVVEYGVRFTKPVVVPDPSGAEVVVTGAVAEKRDDNVVRVDLTALSDGARVLGMARVVLRLA